MQITKILYKFYIILIVILIYKNANAQSSLIYKRLAIIEKSKSNVDDVNEINKLLESINLSDTDKLAIQTTLVHKFQELQKWDTCIKYCQLQISLAHQQKKTYIESSFYKLLGNNYYLTSQLNKAIEFWKKSIELSEQYHYNILLEQCYHNIGAILVEKNKEPNQAEYYLQKAIKLSIQNKTDTTELGNLHYRLLATLYEQEFRLIKADSLYSIVINKARILNDSLRLGEALMFYTKVLSKEKKFEKAITFGKEALQISERYNKLDMVQTAFNMLSEVYFKSGNFEEAYFYSIKANQSLINRYSTDLNSKISEADAKFKNAELKHEKELAIIEAKKDKQFYLLCFITLIVTTGLLINYFYQKRNTKQKLQMQLQVQEEKERLSRDLHDNLGSQMALLSNNVESLDTNNKKQYNINDNIENVKETSKQLLYTLRETIWILNKEQISADDFFYKLIDHAHRYIKVTNRMRLIVKENFAENKILNTNEALQLFRICQEAITNACKYSDAEILEISGKVIDNKYTLGIEDNGKGFVIDKINTNEHYGLKNMAQRAKAINAEFTINATEKKGVIVKIIL